MAESSIEQGYEVWTLSAPDGITRASFIPELGGIGSSIQMPGPGGGRELLFRHPYFWDRDEDRIRGGWPFLFPVCGRLSRDGQAGAYQVDGKTYELPIHGLSPYRPWEVVDASDPAGLTLRFADDEDTRKAFPFSFAIELTYRVEPGLLTCDQRYINLGDQPMPYYAGFHPYFLTPPPGSGKEAVRIGFHPVQGLAYNETLTDVVGEREMLNLPTPVTEPGLSEQLSRVGQDKEAQLIFEDGYTVHLCAEGVEDPDLFPYMQLYTEPGDPFFCIEPWMGFPNALNGEKGARHLPPGGVETGRLRLWVDA